MSELPAQKPFHLFRTHRTKLTAVSAVSAGLLLAAIFIGIIYASREAERRSIDDILQPALARVAEEARLAPKNPDLDEIVGPNPSLSLAEYNAEGSMLAHAGPLILPFNEPAGLQRIGTVLAVVKNARVEPIQIVGALPWSDRESAISRLSTILLAIWAPLTSLAAAATWFAARATFRPLDELAEQAEELSAGNLSARLHLPGDDEFARFAERLNRFLSLLEASVSRQERFIGDAAHELRTPLTVIRGNIETTLVRDRSPDEYRTALQKALDESERLSALVEALLQSAAPRNGEDSGTDLEAAIEKAQSRWIDRFTESGVELQIETSKIAAEISEPELEVVLDNLLSNALRASPRGSTCRIRTSDDNGPTITIEDEGTGIPELLGDRIFERFTRGDQSRNRELGGFGIGLSVCRRLVEARGGTITASNGTVGARFQVKLKSPIRVASDRGRPEHGSINRSGF